MDEPRTPICAICRKRILQRERFCLYLQRRRPYSFYWKVEPMALYFHKKCILKTKVSINDLWELLVVMNKIEG